MFITNHMPDERSLELLKAGLGPIVEREIKRTIRTKGFTSGVQHDSSEWVTVG